MSAATVAALRFFFGNRVHTEGEQQDSTEAGSADGKPGLVTGMTLLRRDSKRRITTMADTGTNDELRERLSGKRRSTHVKIAMQAEARVRTQRRSHTLQLWLYSFCVACSQKRWNVLNKLVNSHDKLIFGNKKRKKVGDIALSLLCSFAATSLATHHHQTQKYTIADVVLAKQQATHMERMLTDKAQAMEMLSEEDQELYSKVWSVAIYCNFAWSLCQVTTHTHRPTLCCSAFCLAGKH